MSRKPKSDVYPMNLEILMELTVSDPDPYFFGAYNWFYTGGALETISANDIDFVFYVTGPNLNIFSELKLNNFPNVITSNQIKIFIRFWTNHQQEKWLENQTFGQHKNVAKWLYL